MSLSEKKKPKNKKTKKTNPSICVQNRIDYSLKSKIKQLKGTILHVD